MNELRRWKPVKVWPLVVILLSIGMTGCTVKLVSDYDEVIDKGTAALHKKLDGFLVTMQSESDDEKRKYKHHRAFYNEVLVDLNALQVRARAIPNNQITKDQLALVKDNIGYLVILHKGGIDEDDGITEEQIKEIRKNGVDTSGTALENDNPLNRALLPPVRKSANSQFGAIMKVELAKRRGEKSKSAK